MIKLLSQFNRLLSPTEGICEIRRNLGGRNLLIKARLVQLTEKALLIVSFTLLGKLLIIYKQKINS